MNQAGTRGLEAAGGQVEGPELAVEVDVEPLTTGGVGADDGVANQLRADAAVLVASTGLGVDEERMVAAVPEPPPTRGCAA
jgi:hypothetical protein